MPNKKEPMGMLATTTLWFTEKFFEPNSSVVVDTAMEVMAPEQIPIMAVLIYRDMSSWFRSTKNDPDVATINATIEAGLEILDFPLKISNSYFYVRVLVDY